MHYRKIRITIDLEEYELDFITEYVERMKETDPKYSRNKAFSDAIAALQKQTMETKGGNS